MRVENMKKFNLVSLLIVSSLIINLLPNSHNQALSQTGDLDFNLAGNGCNSRVDYNPRTQVITLKPGLRLNARSDLERSVCILRVTSSRNDQILVPLSVKGTTRNYGGKMSIAITTNSGANVLSTLRRDYMTSGSINVANLFMSSENPQCASSNIVGANISVFGTNASIDLNDIRFTLQTKKC
jgi:hypothetical protein